MLLVDHVHLVVLLKIVMQMQDVLVVKISHYYRLFPRILYICHRNPTKSKHLETVKFFIRSRSDYRLDTRGPGVLVFMFDNLVLFAKSTVRTWLY